MSDIQTTEVDRAKALQTVKSIMDLHPFDCGQDDCLVCPRHRNEAIDILVAYCADAVKAERERCIGKAKKLIVSVNRNDKIAAAVNASCNATIEALIKLILSDGQEAHRG